MRDDLRELAKLAKKDSATPPPPLAHDFESADSSGYVDLSAFNASDPKWIERELARASAQARWSTPSRPIDTLGPESMTPVSLEALTSTDEGDTIISARRRRRLLTLGAMAAGSCAAIVTLAVVRHAIAPARASAPATAVQAAPPPQPQSIPTTTATPGDTAAAAAPPPVATATAAPASPTSTEEGASATTPATAPKKKAAPIAHDHAPASHVETASAPAHPVASHPATAAAPVPHAKSGGGDSLLDMIKASVDSGKH
jgi:hypothetical protein